MKTLFKAAILAVILIGCASGPNMSDTTSVVNYLDNHKYHNADWGTISFSGNTISFSGHYDYSASFSLSDLDNAGERQIIINGDASGNDYGYWRVDKDGDIYTATGGLVTYYTKQ